MAGPHLVGLVALMWAANPALVGDIARTEQILIETAKPYAGSTAPGCFPAGVPSNAYGYGIVDAYAAVKMALGK
jgi:subtilisin family serine protease